MYAFISCLLRTLTPDFVEKADKWKYIKGYSQVVAIILTELKQNPPNEYETGLCSASIELLDNTHLINPMLPLICDKTNVF